MLTYASYLENIKKELRRLGIADNEYFIGTPIQKEHSNIHVWDLSFADADLAKEVELHDSYIGQVYTIVDGEVRNFFTQNRHMCSDYFVGLACYYHYIKKFDPFIGFAKIENVINVDSLQFLLKKFNLIKHCYFGVPTRQEIEEFECFDETNSSKGIWRCFHFERGCEHSSEIFPSEKQACIYFLGTVLSGMRRNPDFRIP